jgi:hypothetical protein
MSKAPHPSRIFKTPDELLKAWRKYKLTLVDQAGEWLNVQYVGKDGERVTDGLKVPMTFEGFKRYCYENKIGTVEQYFTNQDDDYSEFLGICTRIKEEIRENQIIGGMLGVYNASITQRLNGLADKQQHEITAEPRIFNVGD